ncbi:MAG: zf-HC2 domain-containing protein [Chloroflexota bacterium]
MDHEHCRFLLGSLSEYVDGALADELCAEIERHLESCDNCRVVVDSLRKTVYLYQVTKPPAVMPSEVRQRLFLRLDLDDFLSTHPSEPPVGNL